MGRNFHSVCHECKEKLMHLRGKEKEQHIFANDHSEHEKMTEVFNDYVEEPPDNYIDVFDDYHPELNSAPPVSNVGGNDGAD